MYFLLVGMKWGCASGRDFSGTCLGTRPRPCHVNDRLIDRITDTHPCHVNDRLIDRITDTHPCHVNDRLIDRITDTHHSNLDTSLRWFLGVGFFSPFFSWKKKKTYLLLSFSSLL